MTEELVAQMRSYQSHNHPAIEKYYSLLERIHTLHERVQALSHLLSNESLQLFPDYLQRKSVLKKLGYIDENEAVAVKGRVACEVNTCESLIVTEMVFEGILNELDPTEIVAALSSLIYQQKSDDDEFDIEVPETLLNCCQRMKTIATNLGQLQKEHGLDVDPIEYTEGSLKFGLVHVVYEWAIGVPFSEITQLTTAQKGSIVRCITRLDELCREVRNCARVVGNPTLYRKMEAASTAIKRDIVFAASLYVS
jgi:antiviral helicase SKI2